MSDTAGTKRKADEDGVTPETSESGEPTPKKPKTSSELMMVPEQKQMQLVPASSSTSAPTIARTSSLQAPTMLLSGHGAAVYTVEFNPGGTTLASGGADHQIYLWQVFGDCVNIGVLKSHTASVLQLHWSHDGEHIYSASADKTGAVWDAETGIRTKKLREHTSYVNAITSNRKNGSKMVLTGSDDCTAMLWDLRARRPQHTFKNDYQVLAVAFNDDHSQIFTGGIDNDIKCYDLRTTRPLYSLSGHRDTVTGLSLSPDGAHILSNAMDNTLRMWDIRPYVNGDRQVGAFTGLTHTVEQNLLRCCWSPDGARVSAGSADKFVYVWDTLTKRMLYKLPGHHGSVNDVDFHPYEPILASASSDKKIFMGEL